MAWLSGWQYRRKLTVGQTYIDEDLYDFPVLVNITPTGIGSGMGSKVQDAGQDLRFTADDGETLLCHEIDYFAESGVNVTAAIWVRVPLIKSSGSPTEFYMYYGNPSAGDGQSPANVWDADFYAVWHMNDYSATQIAESTVNARHAMKLATNEPVQTTGKVGYGQFFDGSNDTAYQWGMIPNNFTLSAIFYADGTQDSYENIVSQTCDSHATPYYRAGLTFVEITKFRAVIGIGSRFYEAKWGGPVPTDTYVHVAGTYDGSNLRLYVNGQQQATTPVSGTLVSTSKPIRFGKYEHRDIPDTLFRGTIDEVRVSSVSRSAAWIKAEYYSAWDQLLSCGSEEVSELPSVFNPAWLRQGNRLVGIGVL